MRFLCSAALLFAGIMLASLAALLGGGAIAIAIPAGLPALAKTLVLVGLAIAAGVTVMHVGLRLDRGAWPEAWTELRLWPASRAARRQAEPSD